MQNRRKLLTILLLIVLVMALMCVSAFAVDVDDNGVSTQSGMAYTFWALVPPIVAIVLALITKEVFSSLFIGVLLGALFANNFAPVGTLDSVLGEAIVPAITDLAGNFMFLVILGILVVLINRSGGSAAFGRWAEKNIKSRVGAMFATFLLGVFIFVDDYFNCLTVGSVMLPITDRHNVSRAKLAYLIDATAAPIPNLPFELRRKAGDCSRVTAGPIDLI